jgi:hypothetical protein
MRLGKSDGSDLFCPSGSPDSIGVKGEPVLAVMIPPSSHPPSRRDLNPDADFGEGISQIQFPTKLWAILKSHKANRLKPSKKGKDESEF